MRILSLLGLVPLWSELGRLISLLVGTSRAFYAACRSPRGALSWLLRLSLITLWLWLFTPELGLLRDSGAARLWLTRSDMWGVAATFLILTLRIR